MKKKNVAIVGLQWGDEGKGKIVDILSESFDCVARYQGGHNAGHTVNIGGQRHVLHLIPSGIFHKGVTCVIGCGVVFDPQAFIEEVSGLAEAGVSTEGRLFISDRCHVILPYHRTIESATENHLGDNRLGTTCRGIGPAYEDKIGRRGIRMCDLVDSDSLAEKIMSQVELKNRALEVLRCPSITNPGEICATYESYGAKLRPFVIDSASYLNGLIRDGKSLLLEGAQATLLDIDHGTYPFVTSSSASAGGAATGLGISPKHIHAVIGILKAYATRVGAGPFPTEAFDDRGERLRSRGVEFGSTTGRPRRCGWFDGPAARYSAMINALDSVVVTKIDVLDEFGEIPFCVDYEYKGAILRDFPADSAVLARATPVYKTLRGWRTSTAGVKEWSDLPATAQDYLRYLSDYLEVPLSIVSTGPGRDDTVSV